MTRSFETTLAATRRASVARSAQSAVASAAADAFIQEALGDPIVRLVMRRDGITAVDVLEVIRQTRARMAMRPAA